VSSDLGRLVAQEGALAVEAHHSGAAMTGSHSERGRLFPRSGISDQGYRPPLSRTLAPEKGRAHQLRSGSPICHQSGSLPDWRWDSIAATAQAMRDSPFPQNFQSSLAERL
jgi:hypothetical protein